MRLLLLVLAWLASLGSLAHAGGVTTTTTTTSTTIPITFVDPNFVLTRAWTGSSLSIPAAIGGLVFAPDGDTLYVVGQGGSASSALYALNVVRDQDTREVTGLSGATPIFCISPCALIVTMTTPMLPVMVVGLATMESAARAA